MIDERQAIIEPGTMKIKCPVCGKTNGLINRNAKVCNFRIRCKSSRRNHEHFFILNWQPEEEGAANE